MTRQVRCRSINHGADPSKNSIHPAQSLLPLADGGEKKATSSSSLSTVRTATESVAIPESSSLDNNWLGSFVRAAELSRHYSMEGGIIDICSRAIGPPKRLKIVVVIIIIVIFYFLAPSTSRRGPRTRYSTQSIEREREREREMFLATATWENKEQQKRARRPHER